MPHHFEAKLYAFRRAKDGVVVSYVVHPNDVSPELATASLGTRYMVAVAEIGDDEKPREPDSEPDLTAHRDSLEKQVLPVGAQPDGSYVERKSNAGAARTSPTPNKRKFEELPATQQAGIRCADPEFQAFAGCKTEAEAAQWVCKKCSIASRSELTRNQLAAYAWSVIEGSFQSHLTDLRYGSEARAR